MTNLPSASAAPSATKTMALSVVILAAGQGKRMKSALPKVLHPIGGHAMLARVIATARQLDPTHICVVYGHGGETVRQAITDPSILWAKQEPQQGTGHAVLQAMPHLPADGAVLILYGDVPLIERISIAPLVDAASIGRVAWLTQIVSDPTGLGRIVRNSAGQAIAIVEAKDATEEQRAIHEINTGIVAAPASLLRQWLPTLGNNNKQNEYYLTDVLACAVRDGVVIETFAPGHDYEVVGVNSRAQLAALERVHQANVAAALCDDGVSLADPARIDVRGELHCAQDVRIDVNCIFEGKVNLAANVNIGAHCILRDCSIGEGAEILPYTHIDGAEVGANARIGPYARLRPGTTLANDVHIGNFVEVKASHIGIGSKANHLSYVGDTTVGTQVNIGAGTITCNYDGANKHRTVIQDFVHIGSDVQLVAPVTIGAGADIAAGTTVWKDVAPGGLTLNGKTQLHKPDWKRPQKKK